MDNIITYPRLLRRVQAVLIDSLIIPIVSIGILLAISQFNVENVYIKSLALILPIFILEPGMVSLTGGTIGHHALKISVKNHKTNKYINIFSATFRFIIKFILGWVSLIFVLTTKKHQAIHDFVSGSIVVNNISEGLSANEALQERTVEAAGYKYPPVIQRTLIIISYNIIILIVFSLFTESSLSQDCIEYNRCSDKENIFGYGLSILWIISLALTIIYGWKGKLYGCRRKKLENAA